MCSQVRYHRGCPPLWGIEHQIDLIIGASLPNGAPYRTNPEETKEIQCQVQELLDKGYVCESLSPCAVPILLVPKKDGNLSFSIRPPSTYTPSRRHGGVFCFHKLVIATSLERACRTSCLSPCIRNPIFDQSRLSSWFPPCDFSACLLVLASSLIYLQDGCPRGRCCALQGAMAKEEVYRLLRRSFLWMLKSDHQRLLFSSKSSYPVHPSPKDREIPQGFSSTNSLRKYSGYTNSMHEYITRIINTK